MVQRRAVCAWIALVLVAAGLLAAGPAAAQQPPVVPGATYMADVTAASRALTRVGTLLNGAGNLDALVATVPRARKAVTRFDRRMYAVSRYRVADPATNRQRGRLAAAAPPVTDVLTRYLDAVLLRDQGQMMALSAAVTRRTAAFSAAGQAP
ncbi:MAG TPA: hypothetical protein PKD59_02480 [Miltoncostaeaceae bacterium]|nr:hypothetical protein [Miltoncostaeaceae bacterium]